LQTDAVSVTKFSAQNLALNISYIFRISRSRECIPVCRLKMLR